MRWPSWLAILAGLLSFAAFVWCLVSPRHTATDGPALLIGTFVGGAILLAAGLHSLQASYDAWCGCADCASGCDCCGDGCACGDCGECGGEGGDGSAHTH